MLTKQQLQEEQKQRALMLKQIKTETQQLKKENKLETRYVKEQDKKVDIEKKRHEIALKEFDGQESLKDLVATTSANNFIDYKFEKIDTKIKDNLENNNFYIKFNRSNYIASRNGKSCMMSYLGNDKIAKIIEGEILDIVYLDEEIVQCYLSNGSYNKLYSHFNQFKWEKEGKRVYLTSWTSKNPFSKVIPSEAKRILTKFSKIPVAILPNNSTYQSDTANSEALFDLYAKTITKMNDDIDFGGNKLTVVDKVLKAFSNDSEYEKMEELRHKFARSVISIPTPNLSSLNNSTPYYAINNNPYFADDTKKYLDIIKSIIFQMCGLHESKGKDGAQETDKQVSNQNKSQNDSIEFKKTLREIFLKNIILVHSMVMALSIEPVKEYKDITEIDVEIELSSNQQQELMKGNDKNGATNITGAERPNSK